MWLPRLLLLPTLITKNRTTKKFQRRAKFAPVFRLTWANKHKWMKKETLGKEPMKQTRKSRTRNSSKMVDIQRRREPGIEEIYLVAEWICCQQAAKALQNKSKDFCEYCGSRKAEKILAFGAVQWKCGKLRTCFLQLLACGFGQLPEIPLACSFLCSFKHWSYDMECRSRGSLGRSLSAEGKEILENLREVEGKITCQRLLTVIPLANY